MSFSIETILIGDLVRYIKSDRWNDKKRVPITPERALSQQKNPHALPEDPGLWVAVSDDDGEVIGFCGNLPGWDRFNNRRMGWNTCWWTDPERGQHTAMPLFYRFLQYWDYHVAFADMTSRTKAIVDALGFCHTREETMIVTHVRLSARKISSRLGFAGKDHYPVIFLLTTMVNILFRLRMGRAGTTLDRTTINSVDQIDHEIFGFIQQHNQHDLAHYSQDDFRWRVKSRWLVQSGDSKHGFAEKYPFSYEVRGFMHEWLITRKNQHLTSVSLISVRDGVLKVLYFFGNHPEDALTAIERKIRKETGISTVIISHPRLILASNRVKMKSIKTIRSKKLTGVSEKIIDKLPADLLFQLGDGDNVFT